MAVTSDLTGWLDPLSTPLSRNDGGPQLSNDLKRHSACDECRKRKLKCSGEQSGCSRCRKQSLHCHYSTQKQMGRPRKKRGRFEGDDDIQTFGASTTDAWVGKDAELPFADANTLNPTAALETLNVHPQPDTSFTFANYDPALNPFVTGGSIYGQSQPELHPSPPTALPTPPSPWAYLPTSVAMAQPQDPSIDTNTSFTPPSSTMDFQVSPQCSCLSYLYLSLSNISSLPPLPTSPHTFSTLYSAARTARTAIRCPSCPSGFATAMQNVMLLGTLFNVIGDGWLRVSRANPEELGRQCAPESYIDSLPPDPDSQQAIWKHWQHQIVRRGVIGGQLNTTMYATDLQSPETPDLLSLIKEIEDRQKIWHERGMSKFSVVDGVSKCEKPLVHSTTDPDHDHGQGHQSNKNLKESDFLCLKIVGTARHLLERFDFQPEDYPPCIS